jgi:pimeloyl-ACP methyl ester carboxylesterase
MECELVSLGKRQIATVAQGEGMPLVLLHGFPLDHSMWRAQIEHFAGPYRVIAPDLRGFGRSPLGDAASAAVSTMAEMADDVAALLDALDVGEPVVLCGLSMGGYVAFELWRRHSARLRALVLCDTRAAADSPEAAQGRHATAERLMHEGSNLLGETMVPKLFAASTFEAQPDLVRGLRERMVATSPAAAAAALRGMAVRSDSRDLLREITVPTLVVVGEHDAISTVDEMRAIADSLPNARFNVINGAGHMAPSEAPAAFNAVLDGFLSDVAAK